MSVQLMRMTVANGPRNRTDFIVLLVLAESSGPDGDSWISRGTIAFRSRCPLSAIHGALKRLEADGYISITPSPRRLRGITVYKIDAKKLELAA